MTVPRTLLNTGASHEKQNQDGGTLVEDIGLLEHVGLGTSKP